MGQNVKNQYFFAIFLGGPMAAIHPVWALVLISEVGPSCLQTFGDGFVNLPLPVEELAEKLHLGMEPMSEDCLFLNVFYGCAAKERYCTVCGVPAPGVNFGRISTSSP